MERTIDRDDISLSEHLFENFNTATTDFLSGLRGERLVVKVKQFLAIERDKTSQYSLADASYTDGRDNLAFNIKRVLGDFGDIPITACDLLVSWDEITNESEDGENDYTSLPINCFQYRVLRQRQHWSQ